MPQQGTVKVAAVQADPVHLDTEATVTKLEGLVAEAAENGARIIVFPETFVSEYPLWVPDVFHEAAEEQARYIGRNWYEYWDDFVSQAVPVPGDATRRIAAAAGAAGAYVVVGVNERSTDTDAQVQLFNTSLVFGPGGELVGKRRKLTPVVHERIYHGQGDSRDVRLFPTEYGLLGTAQCFENFSPLYKHALASLGEQIHCALWFALESSTPMVEAAARLHAMESGTWVIVSVQYNEESTWDDAGRRPKWRSVGGSCVVSPTGEFVAGPVYGEETIVYAEIDPALRRSTKFAWDPVGKDARPDVFDFAVRSHDSVRGAKQTAVDAEPPSTVATTDS